MDMALFLHDMYMYNVVGTLKGVPRKCIVLEILPWVLGQCEFSKRFLFVA